MLIFLFPFVLALFLVFFKGEDGVVLAFDLRTSTNQKGSTVLKNPGGKSITGMTLNPADPNYLFLCGNSPFLELYDSRKTDTPAAR